MNHAMENNFRHFPPRSSPFQILRNPPETVQAFVGRARDVLVQHNERTCAAACRNIATPRRAEDLEHNKPWFKNNVIPILQCLTARVTQLRATQRALQEQVVSPLWKETMHYITLVTDLLRHIYDVIGHFQTVAETSCRFLQHSLQAETDPQFLPRALQDMLASMHQFRNMDEWVSRDRVRALLQRGLNLMEDVQTDNAIRIRDVYSALQLERTPILHGRDATILMAWAAATNAVDIPIAGLDRMISPIDMMRFEQCTQRIKEMKTVEKIERAISSDEPPVTHRQARQVASALVQAVQQMRTVEPRLVLHEVNLDTDDSMEEFYAELRRK